MKPVYKILGVSALALTVSLPAMAQQVIDTQANARLSAPQAQISAPSQVATTPDGTVVSAQGKAESVQHTTGTYVSQQEPNVAPNRTAPVFRDPQVATMMAPTAAPVDPMDYKNTESLRERTGFVGLSTGGEIQRDNATRQQAEMNPHAAPVISGPPVTATETRANLAVPTESNPVGLPEGTIPVMQPQQQVMTTPVAQPQQPANAQSAGIVVRSTDPHTQNTHVTVTTPQALAQGGVAADTANNAPSGIPTNTANTSTVTIKMPAEQAGTLTSTSPQQVNRSMVIVGNSDTGVDLDALSR